MERRSCTDLRCDNKLLKLWTYYQRSALLLTRNKIFKDLPIGQPGTWLWDCQQAERLGEGHRGGQRGCLQLCHASGQVVGNVRCEEQHDETANCGHGSIQAQQRSCEVLKTMNGQKSCLLSSGWDGLQLSHESIAWRPLSNEPSYPSVVEPKNKNGISRYSLLRPCCFHQWT